jgi:hypothetical protein
MLDVVRMLELRHPEEEVIERYAMSLCPEAESAAVEEHLLVCEGCRDRLVLADEWVVLLKDWLPATKFKLSFPKWARELRRTQKTQKDASPVRERLGLVAMYRTMQSGSDK